MEKFTITPEQNIENWKAMYNNAVKRLSEYKKGWQALNWQDVVSGKTYLAKTNIRTSGWDIVFLNASGYLESWNSHLPYEFEDVTLYELPA